MEALDQSVEIIRASGGSIQTFLSSRIRLNEESSLEREFITILDRSLPVVFTGSVGVVTRYKEATDYSASSYIYQAQAQVGFTEDIRAFELRYLTFDVWGKHIQTLSAVEIADVKAGVVRDIKSEWLLHFENEACAHYASIAYVAAVRTPEGKVLLGPADAAIREAQRFSTKFSVVDLEPKVDKR